MNLSFEQTLIEVWRQALVENAKAVKIGGESYGVRRTPKRGLRQVPSPGLGIRLNTLMLWEPNSPYIAQCARCRRSCTFRNTLLPLW